MTVAAVRRFAREVPALQKQYRRYRLREIRQSDVIFASYPKSGNTWLKFLITQLVTGQVPDFDTAYATIPMIRDYTKAPVLLPDNGRIIKTHFSFDQLYPWKFRRAIYLVRDGRDTLVSYFYFKLRSGEFDGSFQDFLVDILDGDVWGPWHEHVTSWLESHVNDQGDMLLLRYEDLLDDTVACLSRVAAFLGVAADAAQLADIVESNTAKKMRSRERPGSAGHKNLKGNQSIPFVRSATAGGWRQHFTEQDLDRFFHLAGPVMDRLGYR